MGLALPEGPAVPAKIAFLGHVDRDVHRDVAIIGRINVQRYAAMAGIAGPGRHLTGVEIGVQLRGPAGPRAALGPADAAGRDAA